jgi:hypothetical protein
MNDTSKLLKLVNQLPTQTPDIPTKLVPKLFTDLIKKSITIWKRLDEKQLSLLGCDSTAETSTQPIVAQSQSYITLDKAVNDLINGKHQSRHRTIFQLCYMRDFMQKSGGASSQNSFPLVMFYFPLFVEKIKEQLKIHTDNTFATIKILSEYYKNGDIQGFLDTYDTAGKYFNEVYTDKISHFRDNSRYSFLYGSFVPSIVQYQIETNPLNFSFWISPETGSNAMTFANIDKVDVDENVKVFLWLQELFPESKSLIYDIKHFSTGLLPKTFPDKENTFLTPKNINSGLSYVYSNSNKRQIFIFRDEERLKVLVHEFLHTYKCHNAIDRNKKIMNFLDSINVETTPIFTQTKLNPKVAKNKTELEINCIGPRNPNETLTEITANILNIIRLVSRKNKPDMFLEYFNIERKFSLFQCAKILNHFGVTDINQILDQSSGVAIKQTTNVIPYYIFRAMMYHNPTKLFDYFQMNDDLCYFGASKKGTPIIEEMLTQFTPEFRNDINELIKWINQQNKKNTFGFQTLRMTVFG